MDAPEDHIEQFPDEGPEEHIDMEFGEGEDDPAHMHDVMVPDLQEEDEDDEDERAIMQMVEYFSGDEDDFLDTTADQVKKASKDLQGIPWSTTPWTRAEYRKKRDTDYHSYFNRENEVKAAESIINSTALKVKTLPVGSFYEFYRNWRRIRSTIVHFQLRNLVWPTSAHDVYYVANNRVLYWNNLTRNEDPEVVLDMTNPRRLAPGIESVNVCTLCVKQELVAAGGFAGELVVSRTASSVGQDSMRVSNSDNAITNAIDIYRTHTGTTQLALSNNDQAVRLFDASSLAATGTFMLPWAVNCCVAHPTGRILCAVGDDPDAVLLDPQSGGTIAKLTGHYDYSFAAAWHPDGHIIATGNQDLTTRLFDLRMSHRALCTLKSHIGAVRSLRFSPDGTTLAVAEPADYVTLYDVAAGYSTCQSIDLFGELAGIGFSPDSERFFIGVSDMHYASLVQFNKKPGARVRSEERY